MSACGVEWGNHVPWCQKVGGPFCSFGGAPVPTEILGQFANGHRLEYGMPQDPCHPSAMIRGPDGGNALKGSNRRLSRLALISTAVLTQTTVPQVVAAVSSSVLLTVVQTLRLQNRPVLDYVHRAIVARRAGPSRSAIAEPSGALNGYDQ